ncbi:MAG TPA: SIS domain-containing protein [Candidatus Limnocylindria bacterium]|nr:SIS domain-containing protein [Candidatus Limnocylindria bacterium]
MTDYRPAIENYLSRLRDTLSRLDRDAINQAINLLVRSLEDGTTVYIFGNGGSAATASHFQNDFNKGISEFTQKKFRFQCLNDNVATVMAIANDISYDEVFRFQLQGRLRPGDLVMAISGSGNSKNVLLAAEYARAQGNTVIGLTGYEGGKLRALCDVCLHAPAASMQITEDVHMVYDHLMMAVLYEALAGRRHVKE